MNGASPMKLNQSAKARYPKQKLATLTTEKYICNHSKYASTHQ